MKQTNNAIKFLMAQYRAIFQNAYFKGLATAAVVTMGLAAGQAQAAKADQVFNGTTAITQDTIIINGEQQDDAGDIIPNKFTKIQVTASPSQDFSNHNFSITKGEPTTDNKIAGADAALSFKAKTLTVEAADAGHGLAISSAGSDNTKNAEVEFTDDITVTKGTISLSGTATGTAGLASKEITLAGAATGDANVTVGSLGFLGYDLAKKGAAATDPAPNAAKDVANYSNIEVGAHGKISATATANKTNIHAANLSIKKDGELVVAKGAQATDTATLTLVTGELAEGKITTVDSGGLTVKFAEGDFVKSGASVEKALTLTKGTLDLTGGITLSGDGKLLVTDTLTDLTVTAGKGITLTEGASFAPSSVENANAVAGTLPLNIGANGVLDFGTTNLNVDELTFAAAADKATSTIGLTDATAKVKSQQISISKDLATAGTVQAETIVVKNPASANKVAFDKTGLSANQNLNLDSSDVTVKGTAKIVLGEESAKTIAASEAYKKVGITDEEKKALLLGHAGSINSTNGTLTITSGGVMTVANGTWSSNADIVLAKDSGSAGALKVGTEAYDSAAILSLEGKKLTTTEGAITVGGANTKYAELDLTGATIEHTKTEVTIDKNGVLKLTGEQAQNLLTATGSDQFKTLIKGGATLAVAGDLELAKADFANANQLTADAINLSGDSATSIATLKVDGSLTIKDANNFKVGANNKLVAQGLVLNHSQAIFRATL